MRTHIFFLLLVFLVALFQQANSGEFDDYDDWEEDVAVIEDITDPYGDSHDLNPTARGLGDKIKTMKVKKRCDCSVLKVCGCCVLLELDKKNVHKACFNMTEVTDMKNIELSLVLDNNKLYSKAITEKEKCAKVPYTARIARVCLIMYNMTVDHAGFHVCAKITLKLFTKQVITFDLQCLLMNKRKILVERPSDDPNSALLNINIHKNLTVPHVSMGRK